MSARICGYSLLLVAGLFSLPPLLAASQEPEPAEATATSGCTTSSATAAAVGSIGFRHPLASGNGKKVVVGRDHRLHLVYADANKIFYVSSADGVTWSPPLLLAGVAGQVRAEPTIAVDGAGTLGVAFDDPTGARLYYMYRTYQAATFSAPVQILNQPATQPSLVGAGTRMHLAFVDAFGVYYTAFPSTSPGTPIVRALDYTTICATNTQFTQPSVAVLVPPCGGTPVIRVGYLYFTDERQNPYGCPHPNVTNGAFVQDDQGNYIYSNAITTANPPAGTSIYGVSLSLTADSARFYLAWSDVYGTARTMLARGTPAGNWSTTNVDLVASSVDVAAEAGANDFRLTWAHVVPGYDALYYHEGAWPANSGLPIWSGSVLPVTLFGATNPQTVFWRRCGGGALASVIALYEGTGTGLRSHVRRCPSSCPATWIVDSGC